MIGRLVAFALLMGSVTAAAQTPPAKDSLLVSDHVYQGWKWFHVYCYRCHGVDAVGGQLAPDLRHALGPEGELSHDGFVLTAIYGRVDKGMPSWKVLLDSTQIDEVYQYVRARSVGGLAPGRPHRASDLPSH